MVLPSLRFNSDDYREILEMRSSLEKLSIELCLKHYDKNDFRELDEVMIEMEKDHSLNEFFRLDRTFHTIVSSLSGNRLLHNINLLLWDLLQHCSKEEYYGEEKDILVLEH